MKARTLAALLMAAIGATSAWQAGAQSCTPTAITPYIQVGSGAWSNTSTVTVAAGNTLRLGPQPINGGSWSWSGCASGTAREVGLTAKASCTAVATYTNSCGAKSTQNFAITVPGMRDLTSLQLSKLMGAGWNMGNTLEAIGGETAWGNPMATQALFNA